MSVVFTSTAVAVVALVLVFAVEGKEELLVGGSPSRGVAIGDDLATPEWLQNIPQESKMAKYRKRRFINFPTGSQLAVSWDVCVYMCTSGRVVSGS